MSNSTKNQRNRRFSKFLSTRKNALQSLQFVKDHQGSLSMSRLDTGSYRAVFSSKITGRKAFAYGVTFHGAYQNMIRLYNLKYAAV